MASRGSTLVTVRRNLFTEMALRDARQSPTNFPKLAQHLARSDPDFAKTTLNYLNRSSIPVGPEDFRDGVSPNQRARLAVEAIQTLVIIVGSLETLGEDQAVQAYCAHFYSLLVDCWTDILSWMAFLITQGGREMCRGAIASSCHMLTHVAADAPSNPYAEELATRKDTLDFACMIFCRRDPASTSRHHYLTASSQIGCPIITAFFQFNSPRPKGTMMAVHLQSLSKPSRRAVMASLLRRVEEVRDVITTANQRVSRGRLLDLQHLYFSIMQLGNMLNPTLFTDLRRAGGLQTQASVFFAVTEKAHHYGVASDACWETINHIGFFLAAASTNLSPSPSSAVADLLGGGHIFKFLSLGIRQANLKPDDVLRCLLPYLYLPKVFDARNASDSLVAFVDDLTQLGNRTAIQTEALRAFKFAQSVYLHRKDRRVSMCNNLEHQSTPADVAEDTDELKTCGGCRRVLYCSGQCQRGDWVNHSQECEALAQARTHVKVMTDDVFERTNIPQAAKTAQLRMLDAIANLTFSPPFEINKNGEHTQELAGGPRHSSAPIFLVGFYTSEHTLSMEKSSLGSLLSAVVSLPEAHPWIIRLEHWAASVVQKPEMLLLVGGRFALNCWANTLVFSLMEYSPAASEGERYTILNSVFCGEPKQ